MPKKPEPAKKPAPAKKPEPVKVTKSQLIRDFIAANPNAGNKEISEALKVSYNLVANVKGTMTAKKGKRKRRQQAAEVASVKTGIGVPEIKAAFGLLKHCGGLAQAKEALAAAAEIQKVM